MMTLTNFKGQFIAINPRTGEATLVYGQRDHWIADTLTRLTACGGDPDELREVAMSEGFVECSENDIPQSFRDRLSDWVDAQDNLWIADVHEARTGSVYMTIERLSDDEQIVVRIANHGECYPPARNVRQITLDDCVEQSWTRTIDALTQFANNQNLRVLVDGEFFAE